MKKLIALVALAACLLWPARSQAMYVDGMNVYQYVRSNPVGYTDARGLLTDDVAKRAVNDVAGALKCRKSGSCEKDIFGLLDNSAMSDGVKKLGKDIAMAPINAITGAFGGVYTKLGAAAIDSLIGAAANGEEITPEWIIDKMGDAAKTLTPDELTALVDTVKNFAKSAAVTAVAGGSNRFISLDYSSPFKDEGYKLSCQYVVSATVSRKGKLFGESLDKFAFSGTCNWTCAAGRWSECPCGTAGKFNMSVTGGQAAPKLGSFPTFDGPTITSR